MSNRPRLPAVFGSEQVEPVTGIGAVGAGDLAAELGKVVGVPAAPTVRRQAIPRRWQDRQRREARAGRHFDHMPSWLTNSALGCRPGVEDLQPAQAPHTPIRVRLMLSVPRVVRGIVRV
jgi:hypothetical protein